MLAIAQTIQDRYQLQQQLSDNPIRQTWLAKDLQATEIERKLVVIKFLAFGGPVQWDHLKLFEREASVLKQLNYPRIPKSYDYFHIDQETLWFGLVQQYIPGKSLKQLQIEGKRFTEAEVREIAKQALNILVYLHELNPQVLHRDIKPSNLILDHKGCLYLIDFGSVQDSSPAIGSTFTVVGTFGYAPMEQYGGRTAPASDLYALGATLIHLLSGTSPADLPQYDAHLQFRHLVNASPSFLQWLEMLTEPSVEKRPTSAREAKNMLESGIILNKENQGKISPNFVNNSGQGGLFDSSVPVPDEIKGWNWGAFLFPQFWPLTNQTWIGLLSWAPFIGSFMTFVLGYKGNEWAWKSRKWRSIEQFKAHQRGWAIAGLLFGIPVSVAIWVSAIAFLIDL
jgi:serine/threonine protein kinase